MLIQPHFDGLETAFLQLSFALKLWHYISEYTLPWDDFDIDLRIEQGDSIVCLLGDEFNDRDQIVLAAENNISICFGAASLTLWEAIREHKGFSPAKLDPTNSDEERLATLSYMIRCCFAHGTVLPKWNIRKAKYRTTYQVGNRTIDLRSLNGKPFEYSSIGGFETIWLIRAAAKARNML